MDIETRLAPLSDAFVANAIRNAVAINESCLDGYTAEFKYSHSRNGFYPKSGNTEWTTGFWTGQLWLCYSLTGDERFRRAALVQVDSFLERIEKKIDVEHHDMGFLYSPSCVAAYKHTGSETGRKAALLAADNLISRFHEKGQFIQAWGSLENRNEYRLIVDCLLNLPLLYWASGTTGDGKYSDIAGRHFNTALSCVLRPDGSTYHTYYFDPQTGAPLRGVTAQGNRDGSPWARGQAWAVYGSALGYSKTGSSLALSVFHKTLDFFLSHLPDDIIPYWDFDFTNPSTEPRDSSALAIVICGMMEAGDAIGGEEGRKLHELALRLLARLYEECAVKDASISNGLLLHGTYARKSEYNTCRNRGVDECNIWGDYYYLEALARVKGKWEAYW